MAQSNKARSFGRVRKVRTALVRSLIRSLILHERIGTTEAKAKDLRPRIEKLVTLGRTDTVANRRLAMKRIGDAEAVKKLFTAISPRYKERMGGYTRIVKRAPKATTGRKTAYIAFV